MFDAMIAAFPAPAVTGQDLVQPPMVPGAPRFAATLAATLTAQAGAEAAAPANTPGAQASASPAHVAPTPGTTSSAPTPPQAARHAAIAELGPGTAGLSPESGMPERLLPDAHTPVPEPGDVVPRAGLKPTAHAADADDRHAEAPGMPDTSQTRDAAPPPPSCATPHPASVATLIALPNATPAETPGGAEAARRTLAIAASAAGPRARHAATALATEGTATPAHAVPETPAASAPRHAPHEARIAAAIPQPQRPPSAADAPPAEGTPTRTPSAPPAESRHPAMPDVPQPTAGAAPLPADDPVTAAADAPALHAEGLPRSAGPAGAAAPVTPPAASAEHTDAAVAAGQARSAPPAPTPRDLPVLGFTSDPARQGFDLRLDTQGLGAVEVEVRQADGAAEVVVRSDRADTLAALARDGSELDRALRDAGIGPEGRSMSFLLATGGDGQAQQRQRGPGSRLSLPEPLQAPTAVQPRGAPLSLLDIHV